MNWDSLYMQDFQEEIKKKGLDKSLDSIALALKTRIDGWKDVEVHIAITGDSGAGKSSFINAIRDVHEDDEGAAKVGFKETTMVPKAYDYPENSKVKVWDLPGLGTPEKSDLEKYCEKVILERYHLFLIFTAGRFTDNNLKLALKIKSIGRKFFFVRSKIDVDVTAERRKKSFNQEAILKEVRADCSKHLRGLLSGQEDIFLINNHETEDWDFKRLTMAIVHALPKHQRESLTLTLTRLSTEMVEEKVKILRGRTWMVAALSAAAAVVPVPGVSMAVDTALILSEINSYHSQLRIPAIESTDFLKLSVATQGQIREVCINSTQQLLAFLAPYAAESGLEELTRYVPIIGSSLAGGLSFAATFHALRSFLHKVEKASLAFLKETVEKGFEDFDKKM